jgi:hypothetical protein
VGFYPLVLIHPLGKFFEFQFSLISKIWRRMMTLKKFYNNFRVLHRILRRAASFLVGAIHQTRCRLANGLRKLAICSEAAQALDKRGRVIRGAGADADRRLHCHAGGAAGAGARAADIAGSLDLASFGYFFLQGTRHGIKIQKVRRIYKSIVAATFGQSKKQKIYLDNKFFFFIFKRTFDRAAA